VDIRNVLMNTKLLALVIIATLIVAGCIDFQEDTKTTSNNDGNESIGITTYPTSPPLAITPAIAYSLEEAREKFGVNLPVPSYLPPGYNFQYALQYGEPDNRVSLVYGKGNDELSITRVPGPGNPCPWQETGSPECVTFNGTNGTFTSTEGDNVLGWAGEQYSYCLVGTLERDEMVKIAASI
jgi:hypothetical protein